MSEASVMLNLAARLALRGEGNVEPNPMVGAVIVRDGAVIGMGHHRRFGGLHAEREALADCHRRGNDPRGATMYVTLEPCRHFGKQPPCTDAIIEAGIAKVFFAQWDPAKVSGCGAEVLRQRGVPCDQTGDCWFATRLSEPFVKRTKSGLPWVIVKWAQTVDGRLATRPGENRWISNESSRRRVHRLRARVDAILTGIGTVLADDPLLTARGVEVRRVAKRVVVDTELRLPVGSALVRTASQAPTIVACGDSPGDGRKVSAREQLAARGVTIMELPTRAWGTGQRHVDLKVLLGVLSRDYGVATVMVEAGPTLIRELFRGNFVDEAIVYFPHNGQGDERSFAAIVGRVASKLSDARFFSLWRTKALDGDVELTYRRT